MAMMLFRRLKITFRNHDGLWKLGLFFAIPILLSPMIIFSNAPSSKAGYILLLVSLFLVLEVVPITATVLLAVFLMAITGAQSTVETATSFASETFFLFIAVLLLAISIEETMLHNRLALLTLRISGISPSRLILGFLLISGFLSMWMANTAVTLMVLPIAIAVSKSLDPTDTEQNIPILIPDEESALGHSLPVQQFDKSSVDKHKNTAATDKCQGSVNQRRINFVNPSAALDISKALQLSTAFGSNIGGLATLIGTYPNMLLKMNIEKMYGEKTGLNFMTFLLVCGPMTISSLLLSWIVLSAVFIPGWLRFWQRDPHADAGRKHVLVAMDEKIRQLGPIRQSELTVIIVFLTVIILWLTRDPKIFTGWASYLAARCGSDSVPALLGAALLFVLPVSSSDMLSGKYAPILTWKRVVVKFPWELMLFIGGLTSFSALADKSGLIALLASRVPDLRGVPSVVVSGGVALLASSLTEFMSNSVLAAIFIPILANVGEDLGVNPLYFMLSATIAAQFAFLVPISSFPNLVVRNYGTVTVKDMMKAGIGPKIACLTFLILSLETIGGLVFDLKTMPPWAKERLARRAALLLAGSNGTASSLLPSSRTNFSLWNNGNFSGNLTGF